ncbi:MAG: PhnD/SsuA/transferrin family substrate-binding protein [Alphaproteobacteria bacterium]|nr:PhnD/SsuA/transferrin family substrate-binding protein [Alphaproteobacteria bacterium]MCB9696913.1 PhnD/SsuA/transferrin family substrate-binding protein [Alphaproteobacteria bacterium]
MTPLTIGAVAYDPKVVTIWEGFCDWLASRGLPTTYVLYATYEQQVDAHLAGACDVAWNSPLAWLQTERKAARRGRVARAFVMRDTDRDLTSVVLARAEGPVQSPADLSGRVVATGAHDSPQATLIPLQVLSTAGASDVRPLVFDVMPGKHGDHVGGERDAVRALLDGRADAACVIDGNALAFAREGLIPADALRVVARSAPYDHCVFTSLDGLRDADVARFGELLLSMDWEDPVVRPLLELEGLRKWLPGRTTGFAQLAAAIDGLDTPGAAAVRAFVDA